MTTDVPPSAATAGRVPDDPYASDPDRPLASATAPWWRWLFVGPGLLAVAWGALGVLREVPLVPWLTWFIGSAVVHDFLVAPVVIGVGALLARFLPAPARGPVVVGLVVSALLALVAVLFVLNPGNPDEPGFLPRDYLRNLLLIDGAILLVAAGWAVLATRRSARARG
jgi:hypothetical protein